MLVHPRVGQLVRIHYRKDRAGFMPHHGKAARVVVVAKGPGPRNHGVELRDGRIVCVPCGNLNRREMD